MKSIELYERLRKDFNFSKCKDDWNLMDFNNYIDDEFKKTNMGLLLSGNEEITKVYSMVFPNAELIQKILNKNEKNVLIFTHHPMIWDSEKEGFPFHNIPKELLKKLKDNKISIFVMHVPLDKNGPYSTATAFAEILDLELYKEFYLYYGVLVGVIGKTKFNNVNGLISLVEKKIKLKPKFYNYGSKIINSHDVAVIPGGGNDPEALEEISKMGINTFVTGVGKVNPTYEPSVKFHKLARKYKINVITGTHQATEKFACIKILDYFKKWGLKTEFLDTKEQLSDL